MALPTFFIIGAAKAGTTSLHHYLDQHPQVQMSAVKEPNFFSGPENGIPYPIRRIATRADYERLFDPTAPVRGEASPSYANHPRRQGVPERIAELVPKAHIVYLVRDPIARTVSHHRHRVAGEGERRSLSDALADLTDPYAPCICPSRYATQLELYLRVFPQDDVLVVDQADLLANRRATLREIFAFLGVDPSFDSERFDQELLKGSERLAYSAGYARLVDRLAPSLDWVPTAPRRWARRSLERLIWTKPEQATLEDGLRERLAELFADEVQRLRALTGKAFATWSV